LVILLLVMAHQPHLVLTEGEYIVLHSAKTATLLTFNFILVNNSRNSNDITTIFTRTTLC